MRDPVPDIHFKLRKLNEPRSPLACTLVSTEAGHFVALTLVPLPVARLERGTFEAESSGEILELVRPFMVLGADSYETGKPREAVASFDEAIRIASRTDAGHAFLHLYHETFLMLGLALEYPDPEAAKRAYRDFIALCVGLHTQHPEVLRAVAWAREAVERLTPLPRADEARRRASIG